ncbi:sensor histidine kinase [Paenibacillus segetis]|uniref:histidine kinase n=1 Tax=Paenibacillus segetis TaxID=1325360 RepID=A0ABQ1Y3I6_9BACL|nr:sensor histidine kinase [Paenibacillus segetis]GGH11313.1 histidine kinase [Paenibacillus segetis]
MAVLNFRTSAKVESLVGRELITNNIIAIFELVKNSYDAGATKVEIKLVNFLPYQEKGIITNERSYIEVIDNGKGMTFEEINQNWMELGTSYKEKNREVRMRQHELDKVAKRMVNGEKGIGRFGVDKIGAYLIMESVDQKLTDKTIVYFDWGKFDDRSKLIEEVPCEYEQMNVDTNDTSGLKLKIKNLRDCWYGSDIKKLVRSLKKFLSPMPFEQDEFRVYLTQVYDIDGENIENTEEIINDSFDYLNTSITAEIDINGYMTYSIYDNGNIAKKESFFLYPRGSSFGSVSAEIFYLDPNDKRVFSTKMGMRTSDYGNIKIFRDNFRVMPYGEANNDWLEIDKVHAQGIFRSFGTRDLIGHVIISHNPVHKNYVLKEATDRVGLIEDVVEFEDLKSFIWTLINILKDYIFNRIKNEAKETTELLKNETKGLRNEASNIFSSYKEFVKLEDIPETYKARFQELEQETKEFVKKVDVLEKATDVIDKKIKTFSQMTSKEGILYEMLHTIKNKLTVIDSQIRGFELDLEELGLDLSTRELQTAFEDIYKLVEGSLDKVNASKLKKTVTPVNNILRSVINSHTSILREEDITCILNIDNSENININCVEDSLKVVFENLFSNSIKALNERLNKTIEITTQVVEDFIEVYFSDSGIGIPQDKIRFIFSLWSSNTNGTGIGLATSKDIIEDHDGEMLYTEIENGDFSTTFLIRIPIYN